ATWGPLADLAERSLQELFWLDNEQRLADLLIARPGQSANEAPIDNALRSNALFAVSLGLLKVNRARQTVEVALRYLVVPGASRSVGPLPASPTLPLYSAQGHMLTRPSEPYCSPYEG